MSIDDTPRDLLSEGRYARKQLACKDRIIAWSHASRFRKAVELVKPFAGKRLLDYGCGDGTFLAMVAPLFPGAVGADVDPEQTASCAERFAGAGLDVTFVLTDELVSRTEHTGHYDVVTCMEVLEHCTEAKKAEVLADLRRLVAPRGIVLISVPVEIGPSLLVKEALRSLAAWRKLGDYEYKEVYKSRELWTMVFARERTAIERPLERNDFAPDRPNLYHLHKGFNWRALRAELRGRFTVERTLFSPLGWLGGYVSSQAWFVCRPRPAR